MPWLVRAVCIVGVGETGADMDRFGTGGPKPKMCSKGSSSSGLLGVMTMSAGPAMSVPRLRGGPRLIPPFENGGTSGRGFRIGERSRSGLTGGGGGLGFVSTGMLDDVTEDERCGTFDGEMTLVGIGPLLGERKSAGRVSRSVAPLEKMRRENDGFCSCQQSMGFCSFGRLGAPSLSSPSTPGKNAIDGRTSVRGSLATHGLHRIVTGQGRKRRHVLHANRFIFAVGFDAGTLVPNGPLLVAVPVAFGSQVIFVVPLSLILDGRSVDSLGVGGGVEVLQAIGIAGRRRRRGRGGGCWLRLRLRLRLGLT